jgi:hypothetical protein
MSDFHRGPDRREHGLRRKWLFEEVERPLARGARGVGEGGFTTHHDHRNVRKRFFEARESLQPRGAREDQIQEDRVGTMVVEASEGRLGALRLQNDVPFLLEKGAKHPAKVSLVINDEDSQRRASLVEGDV